MRKVCEIAGEIDPDERFRRLGVDSLRGSQVIAALADRLGRSLAPTLLWEYPTVRSLAEHLCGDASADAPPTVAARAPAVADEPIAIVGMACRVPGADGPAAFWRLLERGEDALGAVPEVRGWGPLLAAHGVSAREIAVVSRGGFLASVDTFEPTFFGISPREAAAMDPQQRLALELAWEALEDAGLAPTDLLTSQTGVFAGAIWSDYEENLYGGRLSSIDQFTVTGTHSSIIANRISYALGLRGPSLTLDSACSSGLVVAHLACESLRRGECTLALAGAVNLNLRPESALAVSRFGALSSRGVCHTFDARADGYVRGEGGGFVVLKRLSQALADGDPVYALIRGAAVNNDGPSNGLTAPSPAAQEQVLVEAYRRAGVSTADVGYVEAHGTATPLGDPIEAKALGRVLGRDRTADAPLLIGSVKTNIGHLEGAAGVIGLIKAALCLKHGRIPASLHFSEANPHAPLTELGLRVVTESTAWPRTASPRIAGVSSFGLGGTNGHVVLEEWPPPPEPAPVRERPRGSLSALGPAPASQVRPVFVFPGQGAQWAGMARLLLATEPLFRAKLTACDREIRRWMGWSLLELLSAPSAARLEAIEVSLPAIIAIDVAIAAWWRARGVEPAAVVGHSTGEIAAAHVAGVLDLADTMRTICAYGRLVGRFSGRGAMAFVGLPWAACADAVERLARGAAVYCAIEDSVQGTVVAGDPAAVRDLLGRLSAEGVFCRPVRMNVGPHSPLVDSVRDELAEELREIRPRPAVVPIFSEVTGAEIDGRAMTPAHWVRNFGDPAHFSQAIDTLVTSGHRLFLGVGPHPLCQHSIETNLRALLGGAEGAVIASLRRDEDGRTTLAEAEAALRDHGVTLRPEPVDARGPWLLPLSAQDEAALSARARGLADHLRGSEVASRDVIFTASVRRQAMTERLAVLGDSRADVVEQLDAIAGGEAPALRGRPRRSPPRQVFVFAGQGASWPGMGARLLREEPTFRAELRLLDALIRERAGWSLIDVLTAPEEHRLMARAELVQPAIFAVQVGVAALLRSWGVEPHAVLGQSGGEIAAATVAGALALEEGVRLIVLRGQVLAKARGQGSMAWVALPEAEAASRLAGREGVWISAANDPSSVLLSGGSELARALAGLRAEGVVCRPVKNVDYASHCPLMEPFADALTTALGDTRGHASTIPMYGSVSAERLDGAALDARYWARNLREPVRFAAAVEQAYVEGHRLFIEVGAHPVVTPSIAQCLLARGDGVALPTLRRDRGGRKDILEAAAGVWVFGGAVDFRALNPEGGRVVDLPAYPWQRERCWIERPAGRRNRVGEHPLLGARQDSALHPEERVWSQRALEEVAPEVAEHGFNGRAVVPGSAYLTMLVAASDAAGRTETRPLELRGLRFERMLELPARELQLAIVWGDDGGEATILSRRDAADDGDEPWLRHASARLQLQPAPTGFGADAELERIRGRCGERTDAAAHYAALERVGVTYGPGLRSVAEVWHGPGEALGRVRVAAAGQTMALLDGCFQVAMSLVLARVVGRSVPVALDRAVLGPLPEALWVHARADASGERTDVTLLDDAGHVVGELHGLRCARFDGAADPLAECAYTIAWRSAQRQPAPARSPEAWLVLGDRDGTGARLAAVLRDRGETCVELPATDAGARLPEDLGRFEHVVFCGALASSAWPETSTESLTEELAAGALGAILVAQAIIRANLRDPPRLCLLTRGAQAIGDEGVAMAASAVWGFARTLALEHPEIRTVRVDLDPAPGDGDIEALADELFTRDEEAEVALRGGERLVARMVAAGLEPGASEDLLREGATYLITGGLGGLGLALAEWLATRGAGCLVLVGRSAPSPAASQKIAAIEGTGARVEVMRADVTDLAQVQGLIAEVRERLPPLRGIVHAAAVIRDRTIARLSPEDFWVPLRPKVVGAWNLHVATRDEALDFFAVYSSLTAMLGALGQASYAASNAFLDGFARARAATGAATMSLLWGPHADVGMTTALADRGARLSAHGLDHFTVAEGCELFGRALAAGRVSVAPVRFTLRRWIESTPQIAGSPFFAELPLDSTSAADGGRAGIRAQLEEAPAADRRALLADHVVAEVSAVLRLAASRIGRDTPLIRFGLDSLMSLEIRNRLERSLDLKLPPTLCFTYPTVDSLTTYLADERGLVGDSGEPDELDAIEGDDMLAAFDASMRGLDEELLG